MRQIDLGNSGLLVPEIALGCMRISTMEPQAVREFIDAALACGVNFFDHADIYGGGESETVFGKALALNPGLREQLILQSKCGIRKAKTPLYDFSKKHIIESVEGSLSRLQTDHLDVLLLHRPDALMEPEEIAEAFTELESSGKVKHFGVSNFNSRQLELLQSGLRQKLVANQLQFGIMCTGLVDHALQTNTEFEHSADRDGEVLDYCRLKGVTVQAWSPFQYGFFEGVFIGSEKFPLLNRTLEELGEKYGVSPSAMAAAWIARHPAKIQTVLGTTNAGRVRDICKASEIVLTREDWYEIYHAAGNKLP